MGYLALCPTDAGDEIILSCNQFGSLMDGSLNAVWRLFGRIVKMGVRKLTITFLNTETSSGRNLRNKIYMRGLNLDLELL